MNVIHPPLSQLQSQHPQQLGIEGGCRKQVLELLVHGLCVPNQETHDGVLESRCDYFTASDVTFYKPDPLLLASKRESGRPLT